MRTGRTSHRCQQIYGWLIISAIVSTAAIIALAPQGAAAHIWSQAPLHPRLRSGLPLDTPTPVPPALSLSPGSGPVGTLVTLRGTNWPASDQIIIRYDDVSTCDGPDLQEIPSDPKPQVDSSGSFSAAFPWPTVAQVATWYICATTSDNTTSAAVPFQVLALNPPSITVSAPGTLMPGQAITVQGQNWLPGGLLIVFELRSADNNTSVALQDTATSLRNGTFVPAIISIPSTLPPGNYILLASAELQALQAQSNAFTVNANPTPTTTPTSPTPSPSPPITVTATPTSNHHPTPSLPHAQLSGTLLALVLISGGMALVFALIGIALLTYLLRSRPDASAAVEMSLSEETEEVEITSSGQ